MDNYQRLTENPFADPTMIQRASPPPESAAAGEQQRVNVGGLEGYEPFTNRDPAAEGQVQRLTTEELQRRQKELDARAAELTRREEEYRRLEDQPSMSGSIQRKNWPPLPFFCPCAPCFYQNIELDIKVEFQRTVRMGYYLWMAYAILLLVNLLGSIVVFAGTKMPDAGTLFGVAILITIVCIPLSYIAWFRPLYKAFRKDSSFNFFLFFFIFFAQCIVMLIQFLGFASCGTCGLLISLTAMRESTGVGGFSLCITCLFAVLTAVCVLFLIQVHRIYRSTGASFVKARAEFAGNLASNETVRDVGTAAAKNTFFGGPSSNSGSRF